MQPSTSAATNSANNPIDFQKLVQQLEELGISTAQQPLQCEEQHDKAEAASEAQRFFNRRSVFQAKTV